jgi:hypothetical protein
MNRMNEIETREGFIIFVNKLSQDFYDNFSSWENVNIGAYLEALAGWTQDMNGFYQNFGLEIPENVDWQLIANMLSIVKGYELVKETIGMKELKTKEEFIIFVNELSQNYYDDPSSWGNINLGEYLEALASWAQNLDIFYQNFGLKIPEKIDWELMSDMLAAAKVYE